MDNVSWKRIAIIVNPAAGTDEPILNTLNAIFAPHNFEWQIHVTHQKGDATKLAQRAVAEEVDLVLSYGGDGTLMEVANGLVGTDIPLGILPGGTGNGVARALEIPPNLAQAAALICGQHRITQIDAGQVNGQYFLLHTHAGLPASFQATRDLKDRFGILAYLSAAFKIWNNPQISRYQLTIDGQAIEKEGMICLVVNSLGIGGTLMRTLPTLSQITPCDGKLDLFLFDSRVLSLTAGLLEELQKPGLLFEHWQAHGVSIVTDPIQETWTDGEQTGQTPLDITIVPQALSVITPPTSQISMPTKQQVKSK